MSIVGLTTAEMLSRMEQGELTAVEITNACLDQIDAHNDQIGAFLHVNREAALEQAALVDEKRARSQPVGKLAGIPVGIKDLLCTKDQPTTLRQSNARTVSSSLLMRTSLNACAKRMPY